MRSFGLVALGAAVACASAGAPTAPQPPASFRAIRTLVLARASGDRAGRPKDPLDGLDESLRARGYTTRVVELGGKQPELAGLERLFGQLQARASATRAERFGTLPYSEAGRGAGAIVADLGVDAVATYHRLEGRRLAPRSSGEPALPGSLFPGPPVAAERGPLGALALVDRAGQVAVFAWGESSALEDPSVPLNAAEAIDLLVRALAGDPPPDG